MSSFPRTRKHWLRPVLFGLALPVLVWQLTSGCDSPGDDDASLPSSPTPTVTPAPIEGLIQVIAPYSGQVVATDGLYVYLKLASSALPSSLVVLLDGQDVTSQLAVDAAAGTVKGTGLTLSANGPHRLEVHVSGAGTDRSVETTDFTAYPGYAIAKQAEHPQELIEGTESRGQLGDYVLYNGRVQVSISSLGRPFDFMNVYGGHLMDGDRVRPPWEPERDTMGGVVPAINIESTDHPTEIAIVNDGRDGRPAVIQTRGPDDLLLSVNPSTMAPLLVPALVNQLGLGTYVPASADDKDIPVEITSTYTLAPGDDYLSYDTTITNQGSTSLSIYIGDYMNSSGEMDYFSPGLGFRQNIYFRHEGQFMAYAGFGGSERLTYGIIPQIQPTTTISLPGTILSFMGQDAQNVIINGDPPVTSIGPGSSFTYRRWIAVVEDVGDVTGVRCTVMAADCVRVGGQVTQQGQPVAGAEVSVVQPGGPNRDKTVVTQWRTRADGTYSGLLPPDRYSLMANLPNAPYPGNDQGPVSLNINLKSGVPQEALNFTFSASGYFQVSVVDQDGLPIPAKASLVGFDPSQDPLVHGLAPVGYDDTGAVFSDVFMDPMPYGLARVALAGDDGQTGIVTVEPGEYELVVSHGPFYSISQQRITIPAGGSPLSLQVQLARVIEPQGFVSGDFHVHGIDSFDSGIPRDFRLTGLAAENVDVFAATDHGIHIDFASDLQRLNLAGRVVGLVGEELTTMDLGHFNAFPLTVDPASRTWGGTDWAGQASPGGGYPSMGTYDLSPSQLMEAVVGQPGEHVFMVNHPNTPSLGYFSLSGLDTAQQPPKAMLPTCLTRQNPSTNLWAEGFTAMEIWRTYEDSNSLLWDENLGDWFNLLNQGIIKTATSDSDTHSRYAIPAGGPRNLVAITGDTAFDAASMGPEIAARLRQGRVINTNAPFLRTELEAVQTGARAGLSLDLPQLVSAPDGRVNVHISVQSALWAPFDRVEVYVNTAPSPATDDDDGPGRTYPHSNCTPSKLTLPDVPRYAVTPDYLFKRVEGAPTNGNEFQVQTVIDYPDIVDAGHLEATLTVPLVLKEDSWVVVLVRGTDGVSIPLFPVMPGGLNEDSNTSLDDLTDGNAGEGGIVALAFNNPLFVDANGDGRFDAPGVRLSPAGASRARLH